MELVGLFRAIEEGEFNPTISDGVVKFYYHPGEYGVVPPVQPSSKHYTENRKNFVYPRSPSSIDRTHTSEPGVAEAMKNGWIIPVPMELFVHTTNTEHPIPETHVSGYVKNYHHYLDRDTHEAVFDMSTKCIVDIPEGYSLLVISPCNYVDHRFTVVPRVLDAGEFPQLLRVPLRVHKETFTLDPGTPLVQVFPFKHSDYEVDATVGVFSPDELDRADCDPVTNSAD